MDSTAGFHAIMNLLLVPMWMVSGSLFPMATAHGWVKAIMWVNPLTYSISLLNYLLHLPNAFPGPLRVPHGDGGIRSGAAAGFGRDGRAKGHAKRGMTKTGAGGWGRGLSISALLVSLTMLSACVKPKPLEVLGDVPLFQLTSSEGQTFDSKSLAGHVWVADFIYTTCDGPCPMMSAQMRRIQDSTARNGGREVRLVHRRPGARHRRRCWQHTPSTSSAIPRAGHS